MATTYEYHSAPAAPLRRATWPKWLFYLGALLLIIAGIHSLYLYWTAWAAPGDSSHWWDFVLGIVYFLMGLLLALATYTYARRRELAPPTADRYIRIDGNTLSYELDQISGPQRIDLSQVAKVERASVRDLIFTMQNGNTQVLPIYLIEEEGEQKRLEEVVGSR